LIELYIDPDIVNRILKKQRFKKMNGSNTPNPFGVSVAMGALVVLTSAGIITIMSLF
jgi:hypothetical protein